MAVAPLRAASHCGQGPLSGLRSYVVRLAFAVLCFLAVTSSPAAATTLRLSGDTVGPWQMWADTALVPTPPGTVIFQRERCPNGDGACYDPATRTIYMRATPSSRDRALFLHELGHDFDATMMTDAHRAGFIKIMRYRTTSWTACATGLGECQSVQERFATGYSLCARRTRISADVRRYGPGAGYGYRPTPSQHRRVCAMIRRAASG